MAGSSFLFFTLESYATFVFIFIFPLYLYFVVEHNVYRVDLSNIVSRFLMV